LLRKQLENEFLEKHYAKNIPIAKERSGILTAAEIDFL